ncbi:MAG: hypothetical protein D6826_02925 [Alphaproteobacteria bacterium]|nr:MAG: hypothetical protein D6826_02925 [Alphaproteobacteria bacterium]
MTHPGTRARVLDKLLGSLESAQAGSRELDIIVTFVLGDTATDAGRMIQILVEEGYPWDVVSELLDEDVPAYTSSLDAAVPGEAIVLSAYSSKRGRWLAAHRNDDGGRVLAWAASECLARRLAALKALRATLAHEAAPEPVATATGRAERRRAFVPEEMIAAGPGDESATNPHGHDEEAETEWKILF